MMTEGERKIIENRQRKAEQAEAMFSNLISSMCNEMAVNPSRSSSGPINIPKCWRPLHDSAWKPVPAMRGFMKFRIWDAFDLSPDN